MGERIEMTNYEEGVPCEKCKRLTRHEVLKKHGCDIPKNEIYYKLKCEDCGNIAHATVLE